MNFKLNNIPDRILKPRSSGLTMVMDKGLSINEAKNFLSISHPHVDIVKLGFGTSFVTPNLKEKIEVYASYNIPIYLAVEKQATATTPRPGLKSVMVLLPSRIQKNAVILKNLPNMELF